ncbi:MULTISPECIES: hypothetical protein [Thermaerobacter]|uniref:Uncharacterized protein n=1 Tax=Thermaerobacter composti TaxID=554949 RepID=A0ABZ0QLY2_9FIRM|nr:MULTISPECIES: hypothetical protein [Thermaerobacter]PZN08818.1 MAG: hypothetical protein DIU76_01745 [Bacillota bacterium]WPD18505.1 hypothetical protein Q5761_09045 [Thermaerobacter composti]
MEDVVPMVDPNLPGVPAVVVLEGGQRLHVRLQAGAWHNGGLLLPVEAVEKVDGPGGTNSLAEVLAVEPEGLPDQATVWIPGPRLRCVILAGEPRRPRPIGFGGV